MLGTYLSRYLNWRRWIYSWTFGEGQCVALALASECLRLNVTSLVAGVAGFWTGALEAPLTSSSDSVEVNWIDDNLLPLSETSGDSSIFFLTRLLGCTTFSAKAALPSRSSMLFALFQGGESTKRDLRFSSDAMCFRLDISAIRTRKQEQMVERWVSDWS